MGEGKEESQAVTLSTLPVILALSTVFARDAVGLPAGRRGSRFPSLGQRPYLEMEK